MAHFGTSALVPDSDQNFFSLLCYMAASSSNRMAHPSSNKMEHPDPDWNLLQPHLPIEQVDWDLVRIYLFDRFSSPPTAYLNRQGRTIIEDVHPNQICEHIMHLRPCPSFSDTNYQCPGHHPEFLLQGNNHQLHRPGWAHSELVAFRSWILYVDRAHWFTIYCRQPNVNGKSPLYIIHYQDILHTAFCTKATSHSLPSPSTIGKRPSSLP